MSHEKPQYGVIDRFFDWLKKLVKEKMTHLLYALLTIAATYIVATWKKTDHTIDVYTILPSRVDAVIAIHKHDSLMAIKHLKDDSIVDATVNMRFGILSRRIDSTGRRCKYIDSLLTKVELEDYDDIKAIKQKLKIKTQ